MKVGLDDGAELAVTVSGEGRDLVLISGLGGAGAIWDKFAQALGQGFRVVRFDQRGIAGSTRGSAVTSIATLAKDTWQVIDAAGCREPVLCGHSTGGAIAQVMALQRPDAASALVLNGSWAGPNWFMDDLFNVRRALLLSSPEQYARISTMVGYPPQWLNEHHHVQAEAVANPPDPDLVRVLAERIDALLAHDCRARLGEIDLPVLVTGAEDDQIVPAFLQRELHELLPGSTLHMFDSGGHFYPVTRAGDLAELIGSWIAA